MTDLRRYHADDLESLSYVLVRFLTGSLSEDGLETYTTNEKVELIHAKKETMYALGNVPRERLEAMNKRTKQVKAG